MPEGELLQQTPARCDETDHISADCPVFNSSAQAAAPAIFRSISSIEYVCHHVVGDAHKAATLDAELPVMIRTANTTKPNENGSLWRLIAAIHHQETADANELNPRAGICFSGMHYIYNGSSAITIHLLSIILLALAEGPEQGGNRVSKVGRRHGI